MGWNAQTRWLGAALCGVVLAGCGGGGDEGAEMEVAVSVDGVADTSNPLVVGEATTIHVASGSTLVFASDEETRWAPVGAGSSFTVNAFNFTSKSIIVSSNGGGTVTVAFADKRDATKTATLTIVVAPKEFARVAPQEGRWFDVLARATLKDGETFDFPERLVTRLGGPDGAYHLDVMEGAGYLNNTSRRLYDGQDRYVGSERLGGAVCTYDNPLVYQSTPMHVGKTWSGSASRGCTDSVGTYSSFSMSYTREVKAFERISVPAGAFDTLRVESQLQYTNATGRGIPGNAYTGTQTCWWSVVLGRDVKCVVEYTYPDGSPGSVTARVTETLTAYSR